MKVRITIALSKDLLATVDKHAKSVGANRSAWVEMALRAYIRQPGRVERSLRDLEIINLRAEALNAEAAEVLTYQIPR